MNLVCLVMDLIQFPVMRYLSAVLTRLSIPASLFQCRVMTRSDNGKNL